MAAKELFHAEVLPNDFFVDQLPPDEGPEVRPISIEDWARKIIIPEDQRVKEVDSNRTNEVRAGGFLPGDNVHPVRRPIPHLPKSTPVSTNWMQEAEDRNRDASEKALAGD